MTRSPRPSHRSSRTTRSSRWLLAAALPVLALTAACGAGTAPASTGTPGPTPVAVASAADHVTLVARPGAATEVFADPSAATPEQVLPARSEFGSALALVVVDDTTPGWLHVQLPTRPNGSTGWIRADGVELREVTLALRVDLAARRLVLTDGDRVVLESPVAVGTAATPTPTGTFFVVDKLDTGRADGPYGPFALGLSAHSEVLTEFAGGDGQVGIHGTADPSSIGAAASNGCVRVPNDVIVALEGLLPLGTPVEIA